MENKHIQRGKNSFERSSGLALANTQGASLPTAFAFDLQLFAYYEYENVLDLTHDSLADIIGVEAVSAENPAVYYKGKWISMEDFVATGGDAKDVHAHYDGTTLSLKSRLWTVIGNDAGVKFRVVTNFDYQNDVLRPCATLTGKDWHSISLCG